MDFCRRLAFIEIVTIIFVLNIIHHGSSNINIKDISVKLSADLKVLKNEELGIPFIEKLYSNLKYTSMTNLHSANVRKIAENLETKVQLIFSAIKNASMLVDDMLVKNIEVPLTFVPCQIHFKDNITSTNNTDLENMFHHIQKNISIISSAIKQQYFVSDNLVRKINRSPFSQCSLHDENIVWSNVMRKNIYVRKNIVLILDHGGSLSKRQFHIVKLFARELLNSLDENDRIAVIGVGSDWSFANTECSLSNSTLPYLKEATKSYINTLNEFVDSLVRGNGATNHVEGLKKGLEIALQDMDIIKNETVMLIYVSRGLLSSLTEPRSVLHVISQFTSNVNKSLIINTCAVIDELKPVMYETHFLQDIADQNYSKYNVSYQNNGVKPRGNMITINKTEDVKFAINLFFNPFNQNINYLTDKQISLPMWDARSADLLMSFTYGWYTVQNNFAILGTDIFFANLAEDISYYSSNQQYSYAFLMDHNGLVLIHPSIARPSITTHQISFVDIQYIEKIADIDVLKRKMFSTTHDGFHITKNHRNEEVEYHWNKATKYFIVCIVVNKNYGEFNRPYKASPSASVSKLVYQNMLDGSADYKLCRHLNQIATLDAASLYLSMSCFQSPFSASRTTQDKLIKQGYLAYLKDSTGLLINPGLKREIKDEVSALAHILDFLRKRHLSSPLSKYIVRRYASSYSGVLQMFPGSALSTTLEATKRPWFLRALNHKNRVILIPPYLDKGGAGYIVTLAFATSQTVVAVDLTYGYVLRLLIKQMPFCMDTKVTCFLIDDQGYIIYHPNLMNVNGARPVEQQHIVHRESLVANDILNHKHFIKKYLCNNYGDKTIQRYYNLNTSFSDVLVNFVPGEHCVTYRITTVPNTNIFVGIVNASCDVLAAFCPCSITDRLCLNCRRMEQKECECPCECPLQTETNSCQETNKTITDNMPCMWYSDNSLDPSFTMDMESQLDYCFPVNCQAEQTHLDCLGIIGCEWCRFDLDGNYLKKPFCSAITSCFNGVFGLSTPYRGDLSESTLPSDTEYSPVGPILGSIIAMSILLVLLFICYRSYTNPSIERIYLSSTQDQLQMSDLNVNENYHDLGNHRDKLLKEDCPNPVSPYCVASTYRRTNTAADSDHGYSTMTPHDESEHLSLAPVEVESLEDDIMSDSTSVHTSISTKNTPHVMSPMFTKIPNRNCMIVPVTVHRNMETS